MQKILLVLLLIFTLQSYSIITAQTNIRATIVKNSAPFEWGEISQEDLDMKVYPLDSTAYAVVLDEYGYSCVQRKHNGLLTQFVTVHKRIKILKKFELYPKSIFQIYYTVLKPEQRFASLKVEVINPDGSVTIPEQDLFTDEKIEINHAVKTILIPKLKPGCIVEFRYELANDFNADTYVWNFQSTIPVRNSKFDASLDCRYFEAKIKKIGDYPIQESIDSTGKCKTHEFVAKNVPALKIDSQFAGLNTKLLHINFQFHQFKVPDWNSY